MQILKKKYDPNKPNEVREFSKEIARLMQSGPAGADQAQRAMKQLEQTSDGRKLLAKASKQAHIATHSFGMDFSDVKVHSGAAARNASNQLGAAAYSAGSHVAFGQAGAGHGGGSERLLAHELAHVVQQKKAGGDK